MFLQGAHIAPPSLGAHLDLQAPCTPHLLPQARGSVCPPSPSPHTKGSVSEPINSDPSKGTWRLLQWFIPDRGQVMMVQNRARDGFHSENTTQLKSSILCVREIRQGSCCSGLIGPLASPVARSGRTLCSAPARSALGWGRLSELGTIPPAQRGDLPGVSPIHVAVTQWDALTQIPRDMEILSLRDVSSRDRIPSGRQSKGCSSPGSVVSVPVRAADSEIPPWGGGGSETAAVREGAGAAGSVLAPSSPLPPVSCSSEGAVLSSLSLSQSRPAGAVTARPRV